MSDFLTNLAARSIGTAATIQPRAPSLFEPLVDEQIISSEPASVTSGEQRLGSSTATTSSTSDRSILAPDKDSIHQGLPPAVPPLFEDIPVGPLSHPPPQIVRRGEKKATPPSELLKPAIPTPRLPRSANSKRPPGIQVTIGRIEVRAVQQSASRPTKREKPKPRLTLDEYLLQRRQGKR